MVLNQTTFLSQVFEQYREIERETVETLGEENAHVFRNIWSDSLEFENAINQTYGQDQRIQSLLGVRLWEFSRELINLHVLFLCANYSLLRSRLRFIWEMIFRAFYADTYQQKSQNDAVAPGPTLDDKSLWLEQLEEKCRLRWGNVFEPTLQAVLPAANKQGKDLDYYHRLWKNLHKYVHPSHFLVETMIDRDGLVIDRFNKEWAKETMEVSTDIFDVIWLVVLTRFPNCVTALDPGRLTVRYPLTMQMLPARRSSAKVS